LLLIEYYVAESSVHGLGVFSKHFIPNGTLVWRAHPAVDRVILRSELDGLPEHVVENIKRHAEYLPEKDVFRLAADGDYFMNHADTPNLRDEGDLVYASRDIMAGEELLCDYRVVRVLAFDPDAHPTSIEESVRVGA
jgi:uncharacterized protein